MSKEAYFDIDEHIKNNYQPVEDRPGYVWLSKRHFQMISVDVLKKSIIEFLHKIDKEAADL